MGQHLVAAFPVWRARRYDGEVQATEHPDTGKWWFRRTYVEPIFHQGRWVDVYKMGKWECPADQPENPVAGMQLMRKRDHTGRPIYKKAMLPIDPSTTQEAAWAAKERTP